MNKKEKFREQLLSQETTNLDYQKTFQSEAEKMYTEKLKKSQRFGYVLGALLVSIFTLFFWAMSKALGDFGVQYEVNIFESLRLISIVTMFLSSVLLLLCLWPAIRGKVGLRFYPKMIRFIFWILTLAIITLIFSVFDIIGRSVVPYIQNEIAWVFTMVMLVVAMGIYMLLSGRIDRGDLKNKAKTLELEYRIAELEEKLNQSK